MDNLLKFSERLEGLMFDANLKSEQLGNAIGVSGSAIRRWLRGNGTINLTNLVLLADYFHCSLDYLSGRNEDYSHFETKSLPPFSMRLREVLHGKGLSRYLLNKNTKFKDKHFWRWDKGSLPLLTTLIELADLCDCTIDYLVGRE